MTLISPSSLTAKILRAGLRRARALASTSHPDRQPKGWLTPEEEALIPPRSLWIGPNDPISHYYRWVWEYQAYLTLLAGMQRNSLVLELGCGHGRLARGPLGYLWHPGMYVGLDVDKKRLTDAQQRIQKRFANFQFIWADVYNRDYNPQGGIQARDYSFPFERQSFDIVFAASLFTHLLPAESERYLKETARVLKTGGRALFSFVLLDHYRGPGTAVSPLYDLEHSWDSDKRVAVRDTESPDALVGYAREWLEDAATRSGLVLERVIPGWWSNKPDWAVNEHDLVLFGVADSK